MQELETHISKHFFVLKQKRKKNHIKQCRNHENYCRKRKTKNKMKFLHKKLAKSYNFFPVGKERKKKH